MLKTDYVYFIYIPFSGPVRLGSIEWLFLKTKLVEFAVLHDAYGWYMCSSDIDYLVKMDYQLKVGMGKSHTKLWGNL